MRRSLAVAALVVLGCAHPMPAARAQNPGEAESTFNAGLMHLREGRPQEALEQFKRAVKLEPKNPYFYKGLGLAYVQLKDYKSAIESLHKALEINQYYVDARNDLGAALILSGKAEEGRKELLAAYNDPTNPSPEQTARNLGQAYFEIKNYPDALNWYRTSLGRNAHYPDAYLGLADTLVAMGNQAEALLQLEAGAKALPDDPNVLVALGEAYYRAGRFTEARAKLEAVVNKDSMGPAGRRAADLLKNFPK